jgi:NitT/TauT family transport system substrate-binding protein
MLSGGVLLVAACGANSKSSRMSGPLGGAARLRLGYFPNLTHAQPNVGIARGTYQQALGSSVSLETKLFNAGNEAVEALFAGELDAAYVGPNPTVNGYQKSNGKEVRVIAGATSGGALLVVRGDAGISAPQDFANRKVASPALGNTQDVSLRSWLRQNGLNAKEQGGNVTVVPTANANTLNLFQTKDIDAAWVPEPWGTRLIQEAGGKLFLDERSLWPDGKFTTTNLIVRPSYMSDHADVVEKLLRAHVLETQFILQNTTDAKSLLNRALEKATGAALASAVVDAAWQNLDVTFDPIASSLAKAADQAYALGFLNQKPDLTGLYDLSLLNRVLREQNLGEVRGLV